MRDEPVDGSSLAPELGLANGEGAEARVARRSRPRTRGDDRPREEEDDECE
jgi:hypothetical protein